MLIRLEPRAEASRAMVYQSPLIAVVLTLIAGMIMFRIMGTDPLQAVQRHLNRRAYRLGPGAWFPGLDERNGGKTCAHRAHGRSGGDEKPAPFLVHAISWHLFLQLDEIPAGSVLFG